MVLEEQPFLYKKTKAGQRGYKRSIPRFVAISEFGICIKWNADVPYTRFHEEAYTKLVEYTEGGLEWTVCVLFKESELRYSRIKTFFKLVLSEDSHLKWKENKNKSREVLDKIKKALTYICKNTYIKNIKTQKEFNDILEELLSHEETKEYTRY